VRWHSCSGKPVDPDISQARTDKTAPSGAFSTLCGSSWPVSRTTETVACTSAEARDAKGVGNASSGSQISQVRCGTRPLAIPVDLTLQFRWRVSISSPDFNDAAPMGETCRTERPHPERRQRDLAVAATSGGSRTREPTSRLATSHQQHRRPDEAWRSGCLRRCFRQRRPCCFAGPREPAPDSRDDGTARRPRQLRPGKRPRHSSPVHPDALRASVAPARAACSPPAPR